MGLIIGVNGGNGSGGGSVTLKAVIAWDGASTPVPANIPAGVQVTYNGTTYTGTLAASSSTRKYIYLVKTGSGADSYDEYMTVLSGSSYTWEMVGSTRIDLSAYLQKAVPTAEQGTKEYLYSFAGQTQNTDIAVINDMTGEPENYTDKMVPTAKSVATAFQTHLADYRTSSAQDSIDEDFDTAITGLLSPQTPSGLPMMAGQPSILFGNGTPQESVVPDNWKQYDPDTDTGYNWNGLPSVLGQQYINTAGGASGRYIGVKDGEYNLKWQNC